MTAKLLRIILPIVVLAFAGSCNHKDLCYRHIHTVTLRVVYDWSQAPEAAPAGMCVFFYSMDDEDAYYRFDFDNTAGGEVTLPAGRYRIITYNNDTEVVRFTATNIYEAHKAMTRTGDILEPLYGNGTASGTTTDNGERVTVPPDELWGCHAEEITVAEQGVTQTIVHSYSRAGDAEVTTDDSGNQTITLYPHDMLCHYSYEVRNVGNIDEISRVSATLSGMSPSMTLSNESLDTECVTLPVNGETDDTKKEIVGSFLTFGHNSSNIVPHKMTFYLIMKDGSKYVVKDTDNLDVTTQVDNAADQRRVHIIIDGLKIPSATVSDEGFRPSVDDWGTQHEDLKI